jgi:hypothetical protein
MASSTTPTITACGTSPVVMGDDSHGYITTGATATGCTITFATAYPKRPVCNVTNESVSLVNAMSYAVSATALTVTQTGLGGATIDYMCKGF